MPTLSTIDDLASLTEAPVRTDPDVTVGYARDTADLVPSGTPLAVLAPQDATEVSRIMAWATEHRVGVVTRGAASGISGGAATPEGCIVVTTERLTRLRELDPMDRVAVAEAGVLNSDLNEAAAPHGLIFAPDPSSAAICSVGGNVATNAGGLRCVRYGATRANVLGLEVVLPDGRMLHTGGRTVKRSTGYDLTQLFIGSEGTLGVVVSVIARLIPRPPAQLTALATFDEVEAAAAAASRLTLTGTPTLVELMDQAAVRAIDDYRGAGFGSSVGSVLLVQADHGQETNAWFETALKGSNDLAITEDALEADQLVELRRSAYPALQQLGRVLVEDVAVPCSRLAPLLRDIDAIRAQHHVQMPVVAHAGDGNAHPLIVVPDETDGEAKAWAAADEIFAAARRHGGTVSGEHGIGRLKRHWLLDEVGEVGVELMRGIKAAVDPYGIMNPGNLLP